MTQIPESIALIDYSHIVRSNFARVGPDETGSLTLKTLSAIRSASAHSIVCLDSKPYWRSQRFEGYKAGRKIEPELVNIWERTLERVRAEGYNIAKAPNEESDDVMSTLARVFSQEYGCLDVRLVTQDKDVVQCLSDRVRQFYPTMGKADEFEIRGPDFPLKSKDWGWHEKNARSPGGPGVCVADAALLQAIMGDASDKIPGVAGIGVVMGAKLINCYGTPGEHMKTLAAIADACVAAAGAAKLAGKEIPAMWRNWAEGMALLPKWLELTTLRTNVELELHPLKYLERIEPAQLVQEEELGDANDSEFIEEIDAEAEADWDRIAEETRQREAMELEYAENKRRAEDLISSPRTVVTEPITPASTGAGRVVSATFSDGSPAAVVGSAVVGKAIVGADPNAAEFMKRAAAERAIPAEGGLFNPDGTPYVRTPETQKVLDKELARDRADASPKAGSATPASSSQRVGAAPAASGSSSAPPSATPTTTPGPASASETASTGSAPSAQSAPPSVVPSSQGPKKPEKVVEIETSALAVVDAPWALATQPRSGKEMLQTAEVLWNSRFFEAFKSYRGVFAVMALGRELGMGYAEALEAFHIVKDRPYPKAVWILSRCQKHRDFFNGFYIVSSSDATQCTIKAKHRAIDEILVFQYTIQEAEQQGHTTGANKDNWRKSPRSMLRARAITGSSKEWCPGATYGMPSAEEAEDYGA
jgi:5'-3' exonuclease